MTRTATARASTSTRRTTARSAVQPEPSEPHEEEEPIEQIDEPAAESEPEGGDDDGSGGGGGDDGNEGSDDDEEDAAADAVAQFSLTPARAIRGVINYSLSSGIKLYNKATSPLNNDNPFDCTSDKLFPFLKMLADRAKEFGWYDQITGILSIEAEDSTPAEPKYENLLEQYGQITLERIREHERAYINTHTRRAQDTLQLYMCLMNSLSTEGKSKILIWEKQYQIGDKGSGTLLLKVIIRESHIDSNATVQTITTKLMSLDKYILTINSDITKFNQYVKLLVQLLNARGKAIDESTLMTNLFRGYGAASDKRFRAYIARKEETWTEGPTAELDADALMNLANEKYKLMKTRDEWDAPSEEEEKLIALQAQVAALKKKKPSFTKDKKDGNRKQAKGKQTSKKPNPKKDKPDFLRKPPKESERDKPINWNGKDWWYCHESTGGKCNGEWRVHHPSKCRGAAIKTTGTKRKADADDENKKLKLKLQKAYQAIRDSGLDPIDEEDQE
jgi:hypothetical protein